jgi:hypothetical protein
MAHLGLVLGPCYAANGKNMPELRTTFWKRSLLPMVAGWVMLPSVVMAPCPHQG